MRALGKRSAWLAAAGLLIGSSAVASVVVDAGAAGASPASYSAQEQANHPALYFPLNEATTAATAATDLAAGPNGTYSASGVTPTSGGIPNGSSGAASFNGNAVDGSTGGAVAVNSAAAATDLNGPFSLEFWAKANAAINANAGTTFFPAIVGGGDAEAAGGYLLWYDNTGMLHFVEGSSGATVSTPSGAGGVLAQSWNLFAVTYDGSKVTWYEDGVQTNQAAASLTNPDHTDPMVIGAAGAPGSLSNFGNVSLQDLAVYTSALSAATVSADFQAGLAPGPVTGLGATAGNGQVQLSWSAPAGATAVSAYNITVTPGGVTQVPGAPAGNFAQTFNGLANGTQYTFSVSAVTAGIPGPATAVQATPHLPSPIGRGYSLVVSDGRVAAFGDAAISQGASLGLARPIVGSAVTADGQGIWAVTSDGAVATYGDAHFFGQMSGQVLNRPIVGMAATPDGQGYWLVASDGGIFSFGDAAFYGSTGNLVLNKPIVGMASSPDGRGYWMVASDGGIFSFGDVGFFGSTGDIRLNKPVVGMTPTADGQGYWMVASDGGIFAFGDAAFYGSTGSLTLVQPIVGAATTPDGGGYWLVAADGGVFTFGDAGFYGPFHSLNFGQPVASIALDG
jgi:hypothetical protein